MLETFEIGRFFPGQWIIPQGLLALTEPPSARAYPVARRPDKAKEASPVAEAARAHELYNLDRKEEALDLYAKIAGRKAKGPAERELAAKALCNKAFLLRGLNRRDEALPVYAEIERRFGKASAPKLRELVAAALFSKGFSLFEVGRKEEGVAACDETIRRFGKAAAPALRELTAKAFYVKGSFLAELNRENEALDVWGEMIRLYGEAPEPALRDVVARALSDKGALFYQLNRKAEATLICYEIARRFGADTDPALRELVATTLSRKKALLGELGLDYNVPDMEPPPDIGAPTLDEKLDLIEAEYGEAAKEAFARRAPARDGAVNSGMAARGRDAAPQLSEAELAAFMAHAASHQWNPKSEEKESPSAFIAKTFKAWLGRGLRLKHIRAAQKNLAGAYSMEVNRAPSNRVAGLIATLEMLPVGAPRPPSSRPIAELSEAEKAERRRREAANTRRYRLKQRQQDLTIA